MLNVRLPEELESRLAEEARHSRRSRSELVREAIRAYLARQERRRFMESMSEAAQTIAEDEAALWESRQLAEDFLPLEDEIAEPTDEYGAGEGWWK